MTVRKRFFKKAFAGMCAGVLFFAQLPEISYLVQAQEAEYATDTMYIPSAWEVLEAEQNSVSLFTSGEAVEGETGSVGTGITLVYDKVAAAADILRDAMVERETDAITVTYEYEGTYAELSTDDNWTQISTAIWEMALDEEFSEGIYDGDYLKWSYTGYTIGAGFSMPSADTTILTLNYTVGYYTTAAQEAQLQEAVTTALDSLDLDTATQYEKAKAISQFISENVTYDYDNLEDDTYMLKQSAYAALVNGTSVCQGYATLYHAMCKSVGMDSRVITGIGNGGAHAWNIIKIDDAYYNVDTTWFDGYAESSGDPMTWFMKNTAGFTKHTRDAEYDTEDFHVYYPMGETSLDDSNPPVSYDGQMFAQYKYNETDDTYTVRLIAEVVVSENTKIKQLGFRFSKVQSGAGDNLLGTKIFKSVMADGETVTARDGMYFVILEIQNVSKSDFFYTQAIANSGVVDNIGAEAVLDMTELLGTV